MSKTTPKKQKKLPLIIKLLIILILLLCIGFVVFYFYMKHQTNPINKANQYVETFISKDTSALFDQLDYTQTDFSSPEALKASLEECHDYTSLTTYSLVAIADATDDTTKTYSVQYWNNDHETPYTQTLTLKKMEEKEFFFFDKWEIDNTEYLAKNCIVGAPSGAKVMVDGTELTTDSVPSSESGNTTMYQLGDLFIGTHDISVTMDGFNEYKTSIYLTNKNYEKQTIYTVTPSMLRVDEKTEKTLSSTSQNLIKAIYSYALGKKEFDALAKKYTIEDTTSALLKQKYNALVTNNITAATHLTKADFTSFDTSSTTTYAEDGCYAVNINLTVNYSTNSTVFKETPSEDGGEPTPSTFYRSGESSSLFTVTFHYKNGNWSVHDTTALDASIYYLKY